MSGHVHVRGECLSGPPCPFPQRGEYRFVRMPDGRVTMDGIEFDRLLRELRDLWAERVSTRKP